MSGLTVLQSTQPSLAMLGPDRTYLLFRDANESGSVDIDAEWVEVDSDASHGEVRICVINRVGGQRELISGAVFSASTGELLRAGPSVSLAVPLSDWMEEAAVVADLGTMLSGATVVDVEHQAAA